MHSKIAILCLVALVASVASAQKGNRNRVRQAEQSLKAIAHIEGPNGVRGTIRFDCQPGKSSVRVHGSISGLAPGKHGFHVHQYGDKSDGCTSMGPHFNPGNHKHAGPGDEPRHIGDLGNIEANSQGVATIDFIDSVISLKGSSSILGRGLVVHAKPDDLGKGGVEESLKTGNAGARVGCGSIGLAKQ